MLLRTRGDVHGLDTGIELARAGPDQPHGLPLHRVSVQPNKAVVGRNAFAHESGIHQDGVLKERDDLRDHGPAREVGLESQLDRARQALRAATRFVTRWSSWGSRSSGNALNQAFARFKEIADKKKQVTALDLEAIVSDQMRESAPSATARLVRGDAGSHRPPHAKVGGQRCPPARRSWARPRATARWTRSSARSRRRPAWTASCALHGLGGHRGRGRAGRGDGDAPRPRPAWRAARASRPTSSRPPRAPTSGRSRTRSRAPRSARPRRSRRKRRASRRRRVRSHRMESSRKRCRPARRPQGGDHRRLIGDRRGDGAGARRRGRRGGARGSGARTASTLSRTGSRRRRATRPHSRSTSPTRQAARSFIEEAAEGDGRPRHPRQQRRGDAAGAGGGRRHRGMAARWSTSTCSGLLYCTHAALPLMREGGGGHIVNVSSVAGRSQTSGSAVYNLTKFGVVGVFGVASPGGGDSIRTSASPASSRASSRPSSMATTRTRPWSRRDREDARADRRGAGGRGHRASDRSTPSASPAGGDQRDPDPAYGQRR